MSKLYQVRHVTRYRYETEISESVMEVRKCPVTRDNQRCMSFKIEVDPAAKLFAFEEYLGNIVHNFDIPLPHQQMTVTAESLVEVKERESLPEKMEFSDWERLGELESETQYLDFIMHSPLVTPTPALLNYYEEVKPQAEEDPFSYLTRVSRHISQNFDYVPRSTQVDSPIDEALEKKQGVCQDFAHIMVGLGRLARIPSRYVSGYLFHRRDCGDRSSEETSHAWMEAYLPGFGWVGFDPTNDILVNDRHIVTCVGRDYKDLPPTKGVFRGECGSELSVAVQVNPADAPQVADEFMRMVESDFRPEPLPDTRDALMEAQLQAQQ